MWTPPPKVPMSSIATLLRRDQPVVASTRGTATAQASAVHDQRLAQPDPRPLSIRKVTAERR